MLVNEDALSTMNETRPGPTIFFQSRIHWSSTLTIVQVLFGCEFTAERETYTISKEIKQMKISASSECLELCHVRSEITPSARPQRVILLYSVRDIRCSTSRCNS